MTWRPVVDGPLRDRVRAAALGQLARLVNTSADPALGPAAALELGDGDAGLAVAFAYAAMHERSFIAARRTSLARLTDGVATTAMQPWLLPGTSGIAWAWHHLDAVEPDLLDTIDRTLADALATPDWRAPLGLLDGLAGIAVFLLERATPIADAALRDVVRHLETRAENHSDAIAWRRQPAELDAPTRERFPNGYFDHGMLRGIAGVMTVLCAIHRAGIEPTRCSALVGGCVSWLQAHRVGAGVSAWADDDTRGQAGHGWCEGGLGIGHALLIAAELSGDDGGRRRAIDCIVDDARIETSSDASLCHGLGGIAQVAARAYHATGDARLLAVARAAVARLVDGDVAMPHKRGLLVGAAGAAIALLASASEFDPRWDHAVLACGLGDRRAGHG